MLDLAKKKILVFDGGMGTSLQKENLSSEDFTHDGDVKEGCNELLVLTRPKVIQKIHESFLDAGADCIETDTFGGNLLKLEEYGIADLHDQIHEASVKVAKKAIAEYRKRTKDRSPKFVVGSIGPTGKLPSLEEPGLSDITFDELEEIFYKESRALIDAGADGLIIETCQDILEMKASITGAKRYMEESGKNVPLIAQVTMDVNARMLEGTDIQSASTTIEAMGADVIGMNCSTGPEEMRDSAKWLSENSSTLVSCIPNAGIPKNTDGDADYPLGPDGLASSLKDFASTFGLNIVGGCCGTTPEHIRLLSEAIRGIKPRAPKPYLARVSSLMSATPLQEENPPLLIGEKTNATGSRKFMQLLSDEDFTGCLQIAKEQVSFGAKVLDISVAHNDLQKEEVFYAKKVAKSFFLNLEEPLMIDSTEPDVIAEFLKVYPGKPIINSINLEGDGRRVRQILPLAKRFGASVIAMTIDEEGMAKTAEKKFEVAKRIYDIFKGYGLDPQDLIFDVLTFTLTTGDAQYRDSAIQTMDAIERIKKHLPGAKTILGVSNCSFGVKPYARSVLNSVFLYHAVKRGLDIAIVNPAHITPYADIDDKEKGLAEDLIEGKEGSLAAFIEHFESAKGKMKKQGSGKNVPLEQRISDSIIHREQETLIADLDQALEKHTAVEIINDLLIPAMREVGDRFGQGELILPFVLDSATIMKRAVSYLEEFMEKEDAYTKGKVVLATVYGDVHDIGKNLLKTILVNNGFQVNDLGKQVPANKIIEEAKAIGADAIGLSALLVSTSKQMGYVVEELDRQALSFPVIVGGAAINSRFADQIGIVGDKPYKGGVHYARDAFTGLQIVSDLVEGKKIEKKRAPPAKRKAQKEKQEVDKRSDIRPDKIPKPPFFGTRIIDADLGDVWEYLNLTYVFKLHWGVRIRDQEEYKKMIDEKYMPELKSLKKEILEKGYFTPQALYGFYPCSSDGNDLLIYDCKDHDKKIARFSFDRQSKEPYLCLADYFWDVSSGKKDVIGFHVTTIGGKASKICNEMNDRGEYKKSMFLHGLAVETAEALAEYMHKRIRNEWGISDDQGERYSFGYPACKDLRDQVKLFDILRPERIGVTLTDSFQMVPEASTSAVILHHKDAKHFNA